MTIVLDSSAAIEIALKRTKAEQFVKLIETSDKTITSSLYRIETANVLWKYYRAGYITKEMGARLLGLAENLIDEFIDISQNCDEALHEAMRLEHSAYDMLYFTLARRHGAALLTLDKKLNLLADKEGIETAD
jgi:predicted nucleic acid-binding protein